MLFSSNSNTIKHIIVLTGPVPPLSPEDSNDQDRAWNSDDERDNADQQSTPHSPMAHYPGSLDPLARLLSRQTISFIEISIEAGILLGGKHKACFVLGVAGIEPMPS
jgi:hypothetical protein